MAKLWFSRPSNWSSLAPPTDPEAAAVPVLSSDPADAGKGIDAYTGSPLPGVLGGLTPDEEIDLTAPPTGFALGTGWATGNAELYRWGRAVVFYGILNFTGSGYAFYNTPIIVLPERWLPHDPASGAYNVPFARVTARPADVVDSSFAQKSSGDVDLALYDASADPSHRGLSVDNDHLSEWTGAADDIFRPRFDGLTFLLPPTATLEP